jgi:hypothetical protein
MRRREFVALIGGTAVSAWPVAPYARVSSRRPLIAFLGGGTCASGLGLVDAFLQGMRELAYIEGSNFDIVYRYADGYAERLPALAQELVRLKPDVILAAATGQAVAAKKATGTIPIVTPALADAVHLTRRWASSRPALPSATAYLSWRIGMPSWASRFGTPVHRGPLECIPEDSSEQSCDNVYSAFCLLTPHARERHERAVESACHDQGSCPIGKGHIWVTGP